jgi:hypothetical protein
MGDLKVLLVHGSPRKINEYLFEDRPDASLERLMDSTGVDVLVCGHTHLPYHRILPSGRQVINAGSVGKPKDGDPRACYLTLSMVNSLVSIFIAWNMTSMKLLQPFNTQKCRTSMLKCCGGERLSFCSGIVEFQVIFNLQMPLTLHRLSCTVYLYRLE